MSVILDPNNVQSYRDAITALVSGPSPNSMLGLANQLLDQTQLPLLTSIVGDFLPELENSGIFTPNVSWIQQVQNVNNIGFLGGEALINAMISAVRFGALQIFDITYPPLSLTGDGSYSNSDPNYPTFGSRPAQSKVLPGYAAGLTVPTGWNAGNVPDDFEPGNDNRATDWQKMSYLDALNNAYIDTFKNVVSTAYATNNMSLITAFLNTPHSDISVRDASGASFLYTFKGSPALLAQFDGWKSYQSKIGLASMALGIMQPAAIGSFGVTYDTLGMFGGAAAVWRRAVYTYLYGDANTVGAIYDSNISAATLYANVLSAFTTNQTSGEALAWQKAAQAQQLYSIFYQVRNDFGRRIKTNTELFGELLQFFNLMNDPTFLDLTTFGQAGGFQHKGFFGIHSEDNGPMTGENLPTATGSNNAQARGPGWWTSSPYDSAFNLINELMRNLGSTDSAVMGATLPPNLNNLILGEYFDNSGNLAQGTLPFETQKSLILDWIRNNYINQWVNDETITRAQLLTNITNSTSMGAIWSYFDSATVTDIQNRLIQSRSSLILAVADQIRNVKNLSTLTTQTIVITINSVPGQGYNKLVIPKGMNLANILFELGQAVYNPDYFATTNTSNHIYFINANSSLTSSQLSDPTVAITADQLSSNRTLLLYGQVANLGNAIKQVLLQMTPAGADVGYDVIFAKSVQQQQIFFYLESIRQNMAGMPSYLGMSSAPNTNTTGRYSFSDFLGLISVLSSPLFYDASIISSGGSTRYFQGYLVGGTFNSQNTESGSITSNNYPNIPRWSGEVPFNWWYNNESFNRLTAARTDQTQGATTAFGYWAEQLFLNYYQGLNTTLRQPSTAANQELRNQILSAKNGFDYEIHNTQINQSLSNDPMTIITKILFNSTSVSNLKLGMQAAMTNKVNALSANTVPQLSDIVLERGEVLAVAQLVQSGIGEPSGTYATIDAYIAAIRLSLSSDANRTAFDTAISQQKKFDLLQRFMQDAKSGNFSIAEAMAFVKFLNDPEFIYWQNSNWAWQGSNIVYKNAAGTWMRQGTGSSNSLGYLVATALAGTSPIVIAGVTYNSGYLKMFQTYATGLKTNDPFFQANPATADQLASTLGSLITDLQAAPSPYGGNLANTPYSIYIWADPTKFGKTLEPGSGANDTPTTPDAPTQQYLSTVTSDLNQLQTIVSGASQVLNAQQQQEGQLFNTKMAVLKEFIQLILQMMQVFQQNLVNR